MIKEKDIYGNKKNKEKHELSNKLDSNGSESRFFEVSTYFYGMMGKKWLYLYQKTQKE
ncbi:MAG: hypothetical protein ACFFFB_19805 [Candidatus Heimdallarchaeota archaeon]